MVSKTLKVWFDLTNFILDDKRNLIVEINRGIDEAQEVLEQLGLEINQNSDAAQKKSQQMRLKSFQAELTRLEIEYNRSKNNSISFEDLSSDEFDINEDQKRKLLDNSERLERTGNELNNAYRLVIETEQIGTIITSNLAQQRESISRATYRLRETNADIGRSGRIVNMMYARIIRDKLLVYIIGLVFILAVILFIYFHSK